MVISVNCNRSYELSDKSFEKHKYGYPSEERVHIGKRVNEDRIIKVFLNDSEYPIEYIVGMRPIEADDEPYKRLYNSLESMCSVNGIEFM